MESHGGYLCRIENFGDVDVAALAKDALASEGHSADGCQLQISLVPRRKIVRLAYQAPFSPGAAWYATHHVLAERLSVALRTAVHAYAIDPGAFEQVVTYGNGRKVGGEALAYADVELDDELDDEAFAQLASRWPLGHLAYVYGVPRDLLLNLPRAKSRWVALDRDESLPRDLWRAA